MQVTQFKNPSTYLIILSFAILGLGFAMAYHVHSTVDNLVYDAKIINETGIIRGSIQRVTKLVLSNSIPEANSTSVEIERLFDHFISNCVRSKHDGVETAVFRGIVSLQDNWHTLDSLLMEFQINPSLQIKNKVIAESELCWEVADKVVLEAQNATEEKMGDFGLFYKIVAVNVVVVVLVILLVFLYVRKKLEYDSVHDPLTGLFNRRYYDNTIRSEIARSVRYNQPLSLIIFDFDKFKLVNDHHGHGVGDNVIIALANEVVNTVRASDMVFRIGGDEFAVICPGTKQDGAFYLAETIRKKVESHSFITGSPETISMGVAEFQDGVTKELFCIRADQALYRAKNEGRNRTTIWTSGY